MAGWRFLLGILVSLQVAQDGVHSCTLRSHIKAPGLQPACSTPDAADPTPAIPSRRTPASCATPTHGQHYPGALNKIPRPGSVSLNPAVPSDRSLPSLSPAPLALITTPSPAVATVSENAILQASAATTEATAKTAANETKSTYVTETAATSAPPSSFPATDPVSASDAVQTPDPGPANVPASAPISASDSTFVAPEASGSALGAISATVSNTVPAADTASASTSDVVPSAAPPPGITTPNIV